MPNVCLLFQKHTAKVRGELGTVGRFFGFESYASHPPLRVPPPTLMCPFRSLPFGRSLSVYVGRPSLGPPLGQPWGLQLCLDSLLGYQQLKLSIVLYVEYSRYMLSIVL